MDNREISQRRYRIGGWANLLEPKLSRLARRQQICFQGRMANRVHFTVARDYQID